MIQTGASWTASQATGTRRFALAKKLETEEKLRDDTF